MVMKKYLIGLVVLFLGLLLATIGGLNAVRNVEGSMGWYSVALGSLGIVYGTLDMIARKKQFSWWFHGVKGSG